jgi:tetrahydromethanopterin S-methyltransferase subunit G
MNTRFDRLESRLDQLGGRVEDVDARSNARIDRLMYWQLGLLGAIAASIVATVLTRLL